MPRTPKPDLETLRRHLKEGLPKRIDRVVKDYDAFQGENPPEEAKAFTAHQAACKAALAHAEMLTKLLRWAEGETGGSDEDAPNIGRLLAEAKSAIGDFAFDETEEEDED